MPLADELEDRKPKRQQGWNQVPQAVRDGVLELALERTDLSPRQLACSFTDERGYFLSESTVYRILKAHDLIVSPARFAAMLVGNGFELAGVDRFGVGHRFTKGRVTIDGLGPDGLSTRRGALTTIPPARTVSVPGGTQALRRSQLVEVRRGDRSGAVPCPSLLGAILLKARAVEIDDLPEAQRSDLAFLLSLIDDPRAVAAERSTAERRWLRRRAELLDDRHPAWVMLSAEQAANGAIALRILCAP